jgi:hypothetical protein
MDPMTTLTTGLDGLGYTMKGWGWLRRIFSGKLTITHPENQYASFTEWVVVKGTHSGVATGKYHFWLMTTNGSEWWLAEEIRLNVNGKWESRVNVGRRAGPRLSTAAVVRVTPVIHALLTQLKRLRQEANDYAAVKIPLSNRWGWDVVTHVSIQIPPGAIQPDQTS